ncbi:TIGR03862 family flavoprotein [Dechloromonas sp. ZY10]|uniref:TIGR03862 family flavoprotein n=1 Tax=Dechloromonas aquae TaxID=2664436 RepID=UPI003527B180
MRRVAIIGGGPAGLMAAEQLSTVDGLEINIFDAMPSLGRKFLMAGKGGMNITHSEPRAAFIGRYGRAAERIAPLLAAFGPDDLRAWMQGLGIASFVGTSGRVFPTEMKAAPLLRAWLHRLRERGVRLHVRHRWLGWQGDGALTRGLRLATPNGEVEVAADAVLLALGGGSWSKLGSDGAWVPWLQARGIPVAPLQPANCGFDVAWSTYFRERFAGAPVKAVVASFCGNERQGEFNITAGGIEGGLVYALSAPLRDALAQQRTAALMLDLAPGRSLDKLTAELARPRGRDSLATHLRRRAGIEGVKAALLREFCSPEALTVAASAARAIKALALPLVAPRPLDEAISSAGGVEFAAVDEHLMLTACPGLFCAGEMLDWEAPTGGYLLTACLASGFVAGRGMAAWLAASNEPRRAD